MNAERALRFVCCLVLPGLVWGQAPAPSFEAATIRRSGVIAEKGQMIHDPRLIALSHVSVQNLLAQAYLIRNFQISGPDWLDTERFDIVAKFPDGATPEQLPAMLQTLLRDRFGLALHREQRTMTAYVLEPGKGPVKLTAASTEVSDVHTSRGAHRRISGKLNIPYFAGLLSNMLDRPVVDETGLKGVYDISVEWADEAAGQGFDPTPSLPAALQEKLGLRLSSRKAPVDIYVIDRVDRIPTPN
jgi:uncharacterized protein (TIGR03435 family)